MGFIVRLFFIWLAIIIASYILPGIHVKDFITALMAAAVLALLNTFVKPILVILTIPITILTLGLFLLVINALIVLFVNRIVPGFTVDGFWWALGFSFVVSIIVSLLESMDRAVRRKN